MTECCVCAHFFLCGTSPVRHTSVISNTHIQTLHTAYLNARPALSGTEDFALRQTDVSESQIVLSPPPSHCIHCYKYTQRFATAVRTEMVLWEFLVSVEFILRVTRVNTGPKLLKEKKYQSQTGMSFTEDIHGLRLCLMPNAKMILTVLTSFLLPNHRL